MRKTTALLSLVAFFLLGFFAADAIHEYRHGAALKKCRMKTPVAKAPEASAPAPEKPKPDLFFQFLSISEFLTFDEIYERRQAELRDIMATGVPPESLINPTGIFAQQEMIRSKIQYLQGIQTRSESQLFVRNTLLNAYQLLEEVFATEIEFLKNYPEKSQNMSFITEYIFEMSSKDQRSGFRFLDALMTYRKLFAEAVREDQTPEINQVRVRDLVTINSLIDKYKERFNIPKENPPAI
ncbi:MAG: hypothetical protein HY714_05135 [Candidatus Omnitrophica bacterium]|nr:hypothetical protein [Candidatus Omnitrophota bacterium]